MTLAPSGGEDCNSRSASAYEGDKFYGFDAFFARAYLEANGPALLEELRELGRARGVSRKDLETEITI